MIIDRQKLDRATIDVLVAQEPAYLSPAQMAMVLERDRVIAARRDCKNLYDMNGLNIALAVLNRLLGLE